MTNKYLWVIAAAAAVTMAAPAAHATTTFDDTVTPGIIMGTGIGNGAFTVDRAGNVELALRGKLRFNSSNLPEGTYNSDGTGTYSFQGGAAPIGFNWDQHSPTTPVWSFEWSINSDLSGTTGRKLNELTYMLEIDGDPGTGTDFGAGGFDPILVPFADHSFGTNLTGDNSGTTAADPTEYANLIANNNVAQNSWNYEFFNETTDGVYLSQLAGFDPNIAGLYTITLSAFNGDAGKVASTSIDINVSAVPIPPALPLFLSGLIGLGAVARRKRKQAAA